MNDEYNSYKNKAYRFISFEGIINTLNSRKLRFSRVNQFNDPLDNSPYLMDLDWKQYILMGYKKVKSITEKVHENILGRTYICCFSKTYTSDQSYLMWSHYGRDHTQLCFEIDFSEVEYLGSPSEVIYPDSLKDTRSSLIESSGDIGRFIVFHKSKVWEYEQEVRLIYDMVYAGYDKNVNISDDKKNIDIPFNHKMISKIVFGYRANEKEELDVISLFKNLKHKPKFEKMIFNPITLKLEPIKYEEYR
ncbi:DUF2971 domain-containing protein [Formosa sp. 3Alg 14/1]|uniref:DUF2971 domain-containing protein n=1 Tax=Formosa sp. 3Alg 14/1 TaxID=3382190 RepID=UPI0039BDD1CE